MELSSFCSLAKDVGFSESQALGNLVALLPGRRTCALCADMITELRQAAPQSPSAQELEGRRLAADEFTVTSAIHACEKAGAWQWLCWSRDLYGKTSKGA